MRATLFQRVVFVLIIIPMAAGNAMGWTYGFISSPQNRPFIAQMVQFSQNGLTLDGSGNLTVVKATTGNTTQVSFTPGDNSTIKWLPKSVTRWSSEVSKTARSQDEVEAISIIMICESCGYVGAKSLEVGAQGLLQIMPDTATGIALQHGVADPGAGIYEPTINIQFGTWYYQEQLDAFGGSFVTAAVAYNGGPRRAQAYVKGGLSAIPAETQRYRRWFSGMWEERHQDTSPTFDAWLAAGGKSLCESAQYELNNSTPGQGTDQVAQAP